MIQLFAVAMTFIDQTIVSIAVPEIQKELGLTSTGVQWAVNACLLALAALFAFGGRLADTVGHRKMVSLGVIVFAGASALCGLTPKGSFAEAWLVIFRAVQGVGGAIMFPAALAIVVQTFALRERGRALALFFGVAGGLTAIGPVLGGFLTQWTWRAIFWVNIPVASRLSYGEATGITQTVRNYAASLGLAILDTILVTVMRSKVAASLVSQGVPSAQANAAASRLSQSRSGSVASIPHFVRLDFADATQTVLYVMAGVMALAAVAALLGLRAGVQEEVPAASPDAEALRSPDLARTEEPLSRTPPRVERQVSGGRCGWAGSGSVRPNSGSSAERMSAVGSPPGYICLTFSATAIAISTWCRRVAS